MAVLKCLGWFSRAPNKMQLIFRKGDSKMPLPMKSRHGHRTAAGKEKAFPEFSCVGMPIPSIANHWQREPRTYRGGSEDRTFSRRSTSPSIMYSFIHSKSLGTEKLSMQISVLSLTNCVTLGFQLKDGTSASHLRNGNNNSTYLLHSGCED